MRTAAIRSAAFVLACTAAAGQLVEIKKVVATDPTEVGRFGVRVALDGDTAAVATTAGFGEPYGSVTVLERNAGGADAWGQVRHLTLGPFPPGVFDLDVSLCGDTLLIGAGFDPPVFSGGAYIHGRDVGGADNWGLIKKLTPSDPAWHDGFGVSVALQDDVAVIGVSGDDDAGNNTGSAYVFARDEGGPGNWGEVKKLTASDADAADVFGIAVATDGATILVGAFGDADGGADSGSAYVFERDEGGADNWGEVAKLTAFDAAFGDRLGASVSVDGDVAVVGSPLDNFPAGNTGSAYVFARDAGRWALVKKLKISHAQANDEAGAGVSVDGDRLAVGARHANGATKDAGAVHLFERNHGGPDAWGEVRGVFASDGAGRDGFGAAVALDGHTLLVGAPMDDDVVFASGSAYVFDRR